MWHSPELQVPCGTEDASAVGTSYYGLWSEEGEPLRVASFRQMLNFEIRVGPAQASRLRRLGRGRHFRPSRAAHVFTKSVVHTDDDSTLWTKRAALRLASVLEWRPKVYVILTMRANAS